MRLETKRLILRELTTDDLDALYAVLSDSDVTEHYPYSFDKARVRGWIDKNIARYTVYGFGLWAVTLRESGELIGDCGVTMQNVDGFIRPEIGYHIRRDCRRRGYASEGARKCRDWAFESTPFNVLCSYMRTANVASAAVARANGMRPVSEYSDADGKPTSVFAITRGEWLALKEKGE